MGVDTRRPQLPAPTESVVDTMTGGSVTGTDLATDVSRRTDKTSYSIPDDGREVTIPTRRKPHKRDAEESSKLSRSSHRSHTSLLIEYFEGGKGPGNLSSRPSVRVKVTPSGARRLKDQADHIQISESTGKKPLYSRRISLGTHASRHKQLPEAAGDDRSLSSDLSALDESGTAMRRPPLEIEFVDRDQGSELSNDRYLGPNSEFSSMPPDSMLDSSLLSPRRKRSQSLVRGDSQENSELLKAPSRRRSRSLSRERIAYKAAQKLSSAPEVPTSNYRRSDKNSSRSASKDVLKKRSHRRREAEPPSADSSLLSGSAVSPRRKSSDQYSVRSAGSRSSITNHNPARLIDQVEATIRRLILPELKEIKRDQKIEQNTSRFERDIASQSPGSSTSKGEVGRRLSKHSSAPEVAKSTTSAKKVQEEDLFHPEDRPRELEEDYSHEEASPSDRVHSRRGSRPEYTEQEMLRRQKSKGLRDAEAAGIVGTALTFAALKHHDSKSSLDKKERKKRKHKSHSRRASMNETETELLFREHNVPPMPMRSGIVDSELTRDSILSQRSTETPTPRQDAEMYDVFRDSPRDIPSPASRRPSLHTPLGTRQKSVSPAADVIAAAAAANLLDHLGGGGLGGGLEPGYDGHAMQRPLSPVQSVASDHHELEQDQDPPQLDDADADSQGRDRREQRLSIDTLSSAPSTELARSTRPYGVSLESRSEILHDGAGLGYEESSKMSNVEHWGEEPHPEEDGAYRRSSADGSINDPNVDMKHLTTFTEDSLDAQYQDRASAGRQVEDGFAANPQYVHAPFAVESAVASLHEPSVLETKSIHSGRYSQSDSINRPRSGSPYSGGSASRNLPRSGQGSPLKEQQSVGSLDSTSFPQRIGATSPPQSIAQSDNDLDQNHAAEDPTLEVPDEQASVVENQVPDTESEIYTNPSIIQGPIGGVSNENRDHWPYHPTPPQVTDRNIGGVTGESEAPYDHSYGQPDYGEAFALNHNPSQPKGHYIHGDIFSTPPGAKDEGYISAANPMSPSVATPEPQNKTMDRNAIGVFDPSVGDDPFTSPSHLRHLSGYSHGIPSPLYDSATGRGIERIQSKDIIALMEHLTVRDAQRNARDTEILVTLVRSAAEMRNSFEEIKKFIAEQDGLLMDANEKHHERTQRVIGGPRPQSASKTTRQLTNDDYGDDVRSKRRNVFRRALQNLSLKSSHDLVRIEGMLEQLLDDVESLRATQDGRTGTGTGTKTASINSNGQTGASYQDGYEPEGQAVTSSTGGHSGYTSNSSRPFPDTRGPNVRRGSENRISTVPEGDEEAEEEEREGYKPQLSTPAHGRLLSREERGVSEPLATPPRVPVASGALSNETTPRKSEEKSRKHKSSSSSFFPKIMSRWSRTTASSGLKDRLQSEASRSGSDLAHGPYNTAEYYDPRGDDRLRSSYTLDDDHHQENRPPSPLVPSQLSENPKYEAHRDSFNLQHPQPRQGPTDRYQTQLESQAQNFANPRSPNSENWGSNSSLPQMNPNANRYSREGRLTPISSNGYSDTSSLTDRKNNPPRPPKVKSDGPLIPPRPPKIKDNEQTGPTGVSPTQPTPQRKPTGPRPITQFSPNNIKRSRYRGSPDQVDPDDDY